MGMPMRNVHPRYPRLRWLATTWLALHLLVYVSAYGPWHFGFLCHLTLLLTVLGLWTGWQRLLSAQALFALPLGLSWLLDLLCRSLLGQHLHGGTAYLWNPALPEGIAPLSTLMHLALPLLLLHCLRQHGYDRRALPLQALIITVALIVSLWLAPSSANLNYVHAGFGGQPHADPLQRSLLTLMVLLVGIALCHGLYRWLLPLSPGSR